MSIVLICNKLKSVNQHKCSDCLPTGLYPEIPEGSQLDFSALKEEVPHYSLVGCVQISFVLTCLC